MVAVLVTAIWMGQAHGRQQARAALQVDPAVQAQLLQAIRTTLEQAHLAPQDLPDHIISAEPKGSQRYLVHVQMKKGDGWFEVSQVGRTWQVRGVNPPSR